MIEWWRDAKCRGLYEEPEALYTVVDFVEKDGEMCELLECGHTLSPLYSLDEIDQLPPVMSYRRLCPTCGGWPVTTLFFPPKGGTANQRIEEAKAFCNGHESDSPCPVRAQCLEFALDNRERSGIWGGFSVLERDQMMRSSHWQRRRDLRFGT